MVTLEPGQTEKTITVEVRGDDIPEPTEHFTVRLSAPRWASLADAEGIATILDAGAAVGVGDLRIPEPDSGAVPAVFTVTLSGPSPEEVSLSYATADGTARAGHDYSPASGTLRIPAGVTYGTVPVEILGDTEAEDTESFSLKLSDPRGAIAVDDRAEAEILDAGPGMAVGDVSLTEGTSGTVPAFFTVTLNAPAKAPVTVAYATADGTATAGEDYRATTGTLSFAPGEKGKVVPVEVVGDDHDEVDESFSLELSQLKGASFLRPVGTATIRDDDEAPLATPALPEALLLAPPSLLPGAPTAATAASAQAQSQAQAQAQAQQQTQQQAQQQAQTQTQVQAQAQAQVQTQAQAQLQAAFMMDADGEPERARARLDAADTNSFLASALADPTAAVATATGATALAIALGLASRHQAERGSGQAWAPAGRETASRARRRRR